MPADLHLHSTASDGLQPPSEVVAAAAAAGLTTIALTDHDTAAGWAEAAAAARRLGLTLLPGAEFSCAIDGISVHLLSYLHDPGHPELAAELDRIRADRVERARRMVRLIAVDYPLSWDDVLAHAQAGATVGRPHIADAMVARGYLADRAAAFASVLHTGSPYYVRHYAADPVRMIGLVRVAGGVPVMAHPLAARRGRVVSEDVIARMAAAGLAGLEADHPDHLPDERARLHGLAGELGLLVTGSSDYHGRGRSDRIGACTTDPEVVARIEAAGNGSEVIR